MTLFKRFFEETAWPMTPPAPYSFFHIALTSLGVLCASLLAVRAAKAVDSRDRSLPARILFSCGLLLAVMEAYKQGFLFFVPNGGRYDWWYFPFQLCSVPMYLGLSYPLLRSDLPRRIAAGFIQDFGLLGGIMALAVPPGLMHPYWTMTLHGFLWHFILIFMGLFCAMARLSDLSLRGFLHVLPLLFACCLLAIAINVLAGPGADADMFYLSPYHPSSQPVFHRISVELGIFPGILLYLLAMVLGGFLVHAAIQRFFPFFAGQNKKL